MSKPEGRRRRKPSQKYERMREEIIDKAAEMFAFSGYSSTGVAELGTAMQLERGALYYYIGSKEQLLSDIHDRVMDPLLKASEEIVGLDLDPVTRLRLLSKCILTQVVERKDHVWVFLHEYRALQGERREKFRTQRARLENLVEQLLDEGTELGLLRPVDRRLSLLTFMGMHNYTYQWLRSYPEIEVEELSSFYCDVFLSGLLVPGR